MLDRFDYKESQVHEKYFTVPVRCWLSIESRGYEGDEVGSLPVEQATVLFVGLMLKWACRELTQCKWKETL